MIYTLSYQKGLKKGRYKIYINAINDDEALKKFKKFANNHLNLSKFKLQIEERVIYNDTKTKGNYK